MKTTTLHQLHRNLAGAFTLVEIALAMAVGSFCLLTVLGLMPVGLASNKVAITQFAASNVAAQIAADLRSAPLASGTSTFGFDLTANGTSNLPQVLYFTETGQQSGKIGTTPVLSGSSSAYFRANVGVVPPSSSTPKACTMVRILVTWPAVAGQQNQGWPSTYDGSFEIVTGIDRS